MADCTVQGIADNATCFRCVPEKDLAAMQVYLLCQILQQYNQTMDCSVQAILDASSCIRCSMSGKELYAAMVYLLCQIADSAGAVGGGSVRHGIGAPVGVNPGTTTVQYTDDLTGIQYTYSGGNWI